MIQAVGFILLNKTKVAVSYDKYVFHLLFMQRLSVLYVYVLSPPLSDIRWL